MKLIILIRKQKEAMQQYLKNKKRSSTLVYSLASRSFGHIEQQKNISIRYFLMHAHSMVSVRNSMEPCLEKRRIYVNGEAAKYYNLG